MSIELSPVELAFRRPFTQQVTQALHLKNPGQDPVAFKVKTTAPKQYCVRPNSGRIEAGHEIEVQVILQAMKEDIPLETKSRDKFLVQSIPITADGETVDISALWHHMELTARASIHEKKIRVAYLPPHGVNPATIPTHLNGTREVTPSGTYGTPTSSNKLSHLSPNDSQYQHTPSRGSGGAAGVPPIGPVSVPASRPADSKNLGDIRSFAFNPATNINNNATTTTSSTDNDINKELAQPNGPLEKLNDIAVSSSGPTTTVSSVVKSIPTSMEELKKQLEEAKTTIARLTQASEEGGILRQRFPNNNSNNHHHPSSTSGTSMGHDIREKVTAGATGLQQQASQQIHATASTGVPVPVVAGLCLLSFLIAYVLF